MSSPYVRERQTAEMIPGGQGPSDERLRERELGVFDLLTHRGVVARYPEEAERRRRIGKLYHPPPGGACGADVALRGPSFPADLHRIAAGRRALVVSHEVPILLHRYILDGLTEDELVGI